MLLQINTWQRVQLEMLLSSVKGPAGVVRKAVKLLDIIEMTAQEKELVGWKIQGQLATWDDKTHLWDVEINDGNLEVFLKETVKNHQQWPANREAVDLFDQLQIE